MNDKRTVDTWLPSIVYNCFLQHNKALYSELTTSVTSYSSLSDHEQNLPSLLFIFPMSFPTSTFLFLQKFSFYPISLFLSLIIHLHFIPMLFYHVTSLISLLNCRALFFFPPLFLASYCFF